MHRAAPLVVAHTFFTGLACSSSNMFPLCELEGTLCAKTMRSAAAFLSSARPLHLRQCSKEHVLGLAQLSSLMPRAAGFGGSPSEGAHLYWHFSVIDIACPK